MTLNKPHYVFAFFSLISGILLAFLMPPISGIDENQHVRHAADIANFKFLNPDNNTEDPLAIWAENAFVLQVEAMSKNPRWIFSDMINDIKNLPPTLPEDRQVKLDKNPYSVHNPFVYSHYAMILNIANSLFSLEPWEQFYILRLTNLFFSVLLLTIAIVRIPEHKILLSALCLLPTMMNARSGVNVDGIVIGCAFLYIGQLYTMLKKQSIFTLKDILLLFLFAMLVGQGKGAYIPLLFLAFLLPKHKFPSNKSYIISLFIVIIPALATSLAWSSLVKAEVLSGMRYTNDNGEVWPDGQLAWITTNPLEYFTVILKTVFASPLLPKTLIESIGSIGWGHNSIVMKPIIVVLIILLATIIATEPVKPIIDGSKIKHYFILIIICTAIGMALTMLYVQWSAYKSPIIDGFQGRYLYPLLPLFAIFVKPVPELVSVKRSMLLLWIFGLVSAISTFWATIDFYYLS